MEPITSIKPEEDLIISDDNKNDVLKDLKKVIDVMDKEADKLILMHERMSNMTMEGTDKKKINANLLELCGLLKESANRANTVFSSVVSEDDYLNEKIYNIDKEIIYSKKCMEEIQKLNKDFFK